MSLDIRRHRREEAAARVREQRCLRRGELDADSLSLAAQPPDLVHAPIRFELVKLPPILADEEYDADDR